MKPSFRSLPSLGLLLFGLSGCASASFSTDVRDVDDFLASHGQTQEMRLSVPAAAEENDSSPASKDVAAVAELVSKPVTADSAVRIALVSNRDLRASIYELGISRGQVVQAGLPPNPSFEIDLRAPTDKVQPLQADIGLEYDISDLILLPLKKGAAEAELAATRIRVAGEVLDTAYRARIAFYEVQAQQQKLDLSTRALKAFQAGYAAAEELHRVGNIPDVDLATHRAAVEQARIEVATAENVLLDAREALNIALGLSGAQTAWTAAGPLPPPDANEAVADRTEKRALEASLDLAELGARMQAASRRVGLYRTQGNLPSLSGGFHGEHDGFSWEIGGHLTVGLPVFDRNQGRVMSSRAEVGSLRERYVATATVIRSNLRTAQNRVDSTGKRARHYRDALLPAREKALSETVLQYNAMQVGVFLLLETQRRLTETALAYVDTLLEYWKARATLDQIFAGRHRGLSLGSYAKAASVPSSAGDTGGGH